MSSIHCVNTLSDSFSQSIYYNLDIIMFMLIIFEETPNSPPPLPPPPTHTQHFHHPFFRQILVITDI